MKTLAESLNLFYIMKVVPETKGSQDRPLGSRLWAPSTKLEYGNLIKKAWTIRVLQCSLYGSYYFGVVEPIRLLHYRTLEGTLQLQRIP